MKKILKSKALIAFVFGFVMFILIILPELIQTGGMLIFDGDHKIQAIPFTYHIRNSILSGNVVWDHTTGLGAQFMSSYAYYNLFSPFSFIYLLLPVEAVIYAVPYVTAAIFGVGTMLGYLYASRFLENKHFAVICGLVYMFSSFTSYNLVFHFSDTLALFPILLIALEELCVNRRKGVFALSCTLMACVNYYFFFGQAVFLIIYFFVRGIDKNFGFSFSKLLNVALEAIIGVLIAAPVLLPVIITLMESNKATSTMALGEYFLYDNIFFYLKLIQSAVMVPDPFCFVMLFPAYEATYPFGMLGASVASYIPLFSVAGVISYIVAHKKKWESVLLIVCTVFAFVPFLNQLFSAANSSYYARWYYMPMLVACVVSLKAIEERISLKPGIITCSVLIAGMTVYLLVADVTEIICANAIRANINIPLTCIHLAISAIGIISLILISRAKRDKEFIPKMYIFTVVNIYMCFGIMSFSILEIVEDMDWFISLYRFDEAATEYDYENPERISVAGTTSNFNTIWGNDSVSHFNSLHDPGFSRFLNENDMTYETGLYKGINWNTPELAGFLGVKYFYLFDTSPFPEQEIIEEYGYYKVIENPYYVPMAVSYDEMITHDEFSAIEDSELKQKIYMKYLVADDAESFSDILKLNESGISLTDEEFSEALSERRKSAAVSLKKTPDGYLVQTDYDDDEIVSLAVSYNKGWKAYIDGTETEVYEINNGLVGIRVPSGSHEVRLSYTVRGFDIGCIAAGTGILSIIAYILINKKLVKPKKAS